MRVLCHNIYWCQGGNFHGFPPGPARPELLTGLAAFWRAANADLLCLQELQDPATVAALAQAWDASGHWYAAGQLAERPQYGVATLVRGATPWRGTALTPACLERAAQCVTQVATGLTVLNLHLRSNRFAPKPASDGFRQAELAALLDLVPHADLVMGDFNARRPDGLWAELRQRDYLDALELAEPAAGLLPGLGDRIWLAARHQARLRGAGIMPLASSLLPADEPLSDHLAIWLELAD